MYEKGNVRENDNSEKLCGKAWSRLYNGDEMVAKWPDSGSAQGVDAAAVSRTCLSDTGGCAATRVEARSQAGNEKEGYKEKEGNEIDPFALPYVMMSEIDYLPTCSGIYFALEEAEQVAYIGQSINIRQRWRAHHVQGDLCDLSDLHSARRVRIAWLEVSNAQEIASLERALIHRFRPRLNKTHVQIRKPNPIPVSRTIVSMKKWKEKMLTVKEAAQMIGESERSIRHWAKSQKLSGAVLEETPTGSYWLIPESALKSLENPGRGRPPKPKEATKKAKGKQI